MLTHLDEKNLPTMVDVTDKAVTARMARAQSLVQLPKEVGAHFRGEEIHLKKGPVFQTAIIAGTMAAKKTHELIPFCHAIPIEGCKFAITMDDAFLVTITCEVKTTYKTGVEMEALNGAMSAALTIYDMVKAVSHEIVIRETKLVAKTGGKRVVLDRPTYGLVLTGGKSERMKSDKALLAYRGLPHATYLRELLVPFCEEVYLSARKDQWAGSALDSLPTIEDSVPGSGPIVGMLSAFRKHPDANWFVVACDLPHVNRETIERLLAEYDSEAIATVFKNADEGFPEPLCALYTPRARAVFEDAVRNEVRCPVKVLRTAGVTGIESGPSINLANINTPEEFKELQHAIG